jgi:hypothetical protein
MLGWKILCLRKWRGIYTDNSLRCGYCSGALRLGKRVVGEICRRLCGSGLERFRFNCTQGSRGEARGMYLPYLSTPIPKANDVYS